MIKSIKLPFKKIFVGEISIGIGYGHSFFVRFQVHEKWNLRNGCQTVQSAFRNEVEGFVWAMVRLGGDASSVTPGVTPNGVAPHQAFVPR